MHESPKILVLGSNGQLGTEIKKLSSNFSDCIFVFAGREEIDVTNEKCILKIVQHNPDFIVNCAAYTAVDKAESEMEAADKLNHIACKYIVEGAEKAGAVLIHISTDYVYNINPGYPLSENDNCEPYGVYAISKYNGEKIVQEYKKHILIRTSWVYGNEGKNFYKTMLSLSDRPELKIVADQYGAPTYAVDLALFIIKVINYLDRAEEMDKFYGIYNFSNEGCISWFDFATQIFALNHKSVALTPVTSSGYNSPAHRPDWSVLSKQKLKKNFNFEVPHWLDGLKRCVEEGNLR
jgi:dTDP-4-dehydrorhamnose reductase